MGLEYTGGNIGPPQALPVFNEIH